MNGWEGAKRRSRQALTSRRVGGVATRWAPEWCWCWGQPQFAHSGGTRLPSVVVLSKRSWRHLPVSLRRGWKAQSVG